MEKCIICRKLIMERDEMIVEFLGQETRRFGHHNCFSNRRMRNASQIYRERKNIKLRLKPFIKKEDFDK